MKILNQKQMPLLLSGRRTARSIPSSRTCAVTRRCALSLIKDSAEHRLRMYIPGYFPSLITRDKVSTAENHPYLIKPESLAWFIKYPEESDRSSGRSVQRREAGQPLIPVEWQPFVNPAALSAAAKSIGCPSRRSLFESWNQMPTMRITMPIILKSHVRSGCRGSRVNPFYWRVHRNSIPFESEIFDEDCR